MLIVEICSSDSDIYSHFSVYLLISTTKFGPRPTRRYGYRQVIFEIKSDVKLLRQVAFFVALKPRFPESKPPHFEVIWYENYPAPLAGNYTMVTHLITPKAGKISNMNILITYCNQMTYCQGANGIPSTNFFP